MNDEGRERRRLKRFMSRIPATYVCGKLTGRGAVKNLSKEGLFVRSDTVPEPGQTVHVLLQPPENPKVEVVGTVRWTTDQLPSRAPGQTGFGLRIEDPPDAYLELFARILLN